VKDLKVSPIADVSIALASDEIDQLVTSVTFVPVD
jgi:hypothetical protein